MSWKINGITVIETSKVNGITWGTGKKYNGIQLNVCYYYDLTNNNPPFPPQPPITFSYSDCSGNPSNQNVDSGQNAQICALVDSVSFGGNGTATKGSRCN